MPKYMERDAAMLTPILPKEYRQYQTENLDDAYEQGWLDALGNLKNAPAVDVVPVVHGRWLDNEDYMFCSICGIQWNYCDNDTETFNYCPNCGAKMDLEDIHE